MKKDDKDLLLRDLSSRLPYGIKGYWTPKHSESIKPKVRILTPSDLNIEDVVKFKPYLRPMSSMTEEEKEWYESMTHIGDEEYVTASWCSSIIDWLNAHHFDYHGLIEKGLAIAITEENNPYE